MMARLTGLSPVDSMSAVIIHTSDWRLGASLQGSSRFTEQERFLSWLLGALDEHKADALLVAGNIFDGTHPDPASMQLFYSFLAKAADPHRGCAVILLAGSFDSGVLLDAPASLMKHLGIHLLGQPDADPQRALITVGSDRSQPSAVIAAMPFVHPLTLGIRAVGQQPQEQARALTEALATRYGQLADAAALMAPRCPLIGAGHLAASGLPSAEQSRALPPIGHAGLPAETIFDPRFKHVALGHSRSTRALDSGRVWYSGAPLALTMDDVERSQNVLRIDVDGEVVVTPVEVPRFRDIQTLRGPIEQILSSIAAFQSKAPLPAWLDICVEGARPGVDLEQAIHTTLARFAARHRPRVLQLRRVESQKTPAQKRPSKTPRTPSEVFEALALETLGHAPEPDMLDCFKTLLDAKDGTP